MSDADTGSTEQASSKAADTSSMEQASLTAAVPSTPPPPAAGVGDRWAARIHEVVSGLVILGALTFLYGVVVIAVHNFSQGIAGTANSPATAPSASNAVAIIGSVTGAAGSIIAAFFGVRAVADQSSQREQTTQQTMQSQALQTEQVAKQAHLGVQLAQEAAKGSDEREKVATAAAAALLGRLPPDQAEHATSDPAVRRLLYFE